MRLVPLGILCALAATAAAYPDTSLIRREIRVHMGEFKACYEKELAKNPKLEGKVVANFTIDKTGKVLASTATGLPVVEDCVADVILKKLQFPPNGKGTIQVSYPFLFKPG